jgi:hypothetical protein
VTARRGLGSGVCNPFIEITDLDPERLGNAVQPAGGYTVDAFRRSQSVGTIGLG